MAARHDLQDAGRAPLRELLGAGLRDIGAELHPWLTPLLEEEINVHKSYAGNLAVRLEVEKARCLSDTLAESLGQVPWLHRIASAIAPVG